MTEEMKRNANLDLEDEMEMEGGELKPVPSDDDQQEEKKRGFFGRVKDRVVGAAREVKEHLPLAGISALIGGAAGVGGMILIDKLINKDEVDSDDLTPYITAPSEPIEIPAETPTVEIPEMTTEE